VLNNVRRSPHSSYYYEYGDYYGKPAKVAKKQPVAPTVEERPNPNGRPSLLPRHEKQGQENGSPTQTNGVYQLREPEDENR
jgi:hypothetical protein